MEIKTIEGFLEWAKEVNWCLIHHRQIDHGESGILDYWTFLTPLGERVNVTSEGKKIIS